MKATAQLQMNSTGAEAKTAPVVTSYDTQRLRLHHFLSRSRANGPGVRAVIWVQGCTLACPGCFNAPTHPKAGGEGFVSVDELFARIVALGHTIEGITISGGEPLQQLEPVAALIRRVKAETKLSVVLFTGFYWSELEQIGQTEYRRHLSQTSSYQEQAIVPSQIPVGTFADTVISTTTRLIKAQVGEAGAIEEIELATQLSLAVLKDVDVLIAGRYRQARHLAQDLRGSANKTTYFLTGRYSPADMQAVSPAEVTITPQGHIILSGIDPLKFNQAQIKAVSDIG